MAVAGGIDNWPGFCRDCLSDAVEAPCPNCGSTRVVSHPALDRLSIAHMDCDAFYAAIEKRDDPSLNDRPLIVGGETRGVVSTACYLARKYGVRSAMPMFPAKNLCPRAGAQNPRHVETPPPGGGAAVAGRSLSRSFRHRAHPWYEPRPHFGEA